MFHDYTPEECHNHKDRVAIYYEDQSVLYFCGDCRNGLKNASERDLYLMTHSEKLETKPEPVIDLLESKKESKPSKK